MAFLIGISVPSIVRTAEITTVDFTSWSELPSDWVYTEGIKGAPGDVDLTEEGLSLFDFAAATPDLDAGSGWSIRTKGRLLQEGYGAFGIQTGMEQGDEVVAAAWIGIKANGDVIGGPNGTTVQFGSSGLDPTEDVVLQLDALDNRLRIWAWPPGSITETDVVQLSDLELILPESMPGIWASPHRPFGPSESIFEYMMYSTERIPTPGSLTGDFDKDGVVTSQDMDLLTKQVLAGVHDGNFDVSYDGRVDQEDRRVWVEHLNGTYFGDANLDGEFNSSDLVQIFQKGEYEDLVVANSTWADGDWNGDLEFDSGDLVAAFQAGGFETGPRRLEARAVPEPSSLILFAVGVAAVYRWRNSARR